MITDAEAREAQQRTAEILARPGAMVLVGAESPEGTKQRARQFAEFYNRGDRYLEVPWMQPGAVVVIASVAIEERSRPGLPRNRRNIYEDVSWVQLLFASDQN